MADCEEIRSSYIAAVEEGFACSPLDRTRFLVTLPNLYADGDPLEAIVWYRGERVVVTDGGEAVGRLDLAGINTGRRGFEERIRRAVRRYRVDVLEGALQVDGPSADVGDLLLRMTSAMHVVEALLPSLGARPTLRRFDQQVVRFLQQRQQHVRVRPVVRGRSGSEYQVTASVGEARPVLIQTVSASVSNPYAVDHALRVFSDVNGQVQPEEKVSLLAGSADSWRSGDINILRDVSVVSTWQSRQLLENVFRGHVPADRVLFDPVQEELAHAFEAPRRLVVDRAGEEPAPPRELPSGTFE